MLRGDAAGQANTGRSPPPADRVPALGTMRTLLAISVLIQHSSPIFGIRLLAGDPAVICFFVISGFLMTLILNEKYQDLKAFYVNRGLRIYVPYLSAALLSLVLFLVVADMPYNPLRTYARALDAGNVLWVAWGTISNVTLVGTDLLRYGMIEPGFATLVFPSFLHGITTGGHELLLVPQSWTLAIELQFYLVAPFLVRLRLRWILLATIALLFIRASVYNQLRALNFPIDDSAIFPMMLAYFLLGTVAYHGYRVWRDASFSPAVKRGVSALMLLLGITLIFTGHVLLEDATREAYDLFYLAIAVVLPFAFHLTSDWRWDSRVGDYSYPIYLFHFVLASLMVALGVPSTSTGPWVLVATIAVCTVFLQLVDKPLQRVRRRIAARGRAPASRPGEAPA